MAGNPRIDELRKKLDKEPGSRLFAQLAEELRKDGDFEDAISVAREGLQKHPNYPSARLTLGHALYDTGEWDAARVEFELVLKGAPDNILASRLLGESLENLGDVPGALSRYKKTLVLAPGDKQVLARIEGLEKSPVAGAAASPAPAAPPVAARPATPPPAPVAAPASEAATVVIAAPPAPATPAPPPPIKVSEVDTPMVLETAHERATAFAAPTPAAPAAATAPPSERSPASSEPAPIPLAAADDHFELERAYEPPPPAPPASARSDASRPPLAAAAPTRESPPAEPGMMEFEFEGGQGGTIPFAPAPAAVAPAVSPPAPAAQPAPEPEPPLAPSWPPTTTTATEAFGVGASAPAISAQGAAPSHSVEVHREPAPPTPGELMSPTLAELYFNQGFTDKAIDVYRQLAEREPGNDRLRRRLAELEGIGHPVTPHAQAEPAASPQAAGVPPGPDGAARRVVLERTIARLEGMLAAIKKG